MSENRSRTESQNPPKSDACEVRSATLPSMKSKMFATTMMAPAMKNAPVASAQAETALMTSPVNVSTFG